MFCNRKTEEFSTKEKRNISFHRHEAGDCYQWNSFNFFMRIMSHSLLLSE